MTAPVSTPPPVSAATPAPPAAPIAAPSPAEARVLFGAVDAQAAKGRDAAAINAITAFFMMLLLEAPSAAASRPSGTRIGLPCARTATFVRSSELGRKRCDELPC